VRIVPRDSKLYAPKYNRDLIIENNFPADLRYNLDFLSLDIADLEVDVVEDLEEVQNDGVYNGTVAASYNAAGMNVPVNADVQVLVGQTGLVVFKVDGGGSQHINIAPGISISGDYTWNGRAEDEMQGNYFEAVGSGSYFSDATINSAAPLPPEYAYQSMSGDDGYLTVSGTIENGQASGTIAYSAPSGGVIAGSWSATLAQ